MTTCAACGSSCSSAGNEYCGSWSRLRGSPAAPTTTAACAGWASSTCDHVGDHAGDVVGRTGGERGVDERGDHGHGVRQRQQLVHPLVGDVAREPVAAHEVAVAHVRLADGDVGLGRVHRVDRAHEQVAPRVDQGLLRGDLPGVDEGLDVGVVAGDLREDALAQQVRPRVADVQHGHARRRTAEPGERGERGAHPGELGVRGDDVGDALAGEDDGVGEPLERLGVVETGGLHLRHRGDGRRRGELAGGVPAHAVGDDDELVAGVPGVLVAGAHEPDVRARGGAQDQRHRAITSAARGRCGRP